MATQPKTVHEILSACPACHTTPNGLILVGDDGGGFAFTKTRYGWKYNGTTLDDEQAQYVSNLAKHAARDEMVGRGLAVAGRIYNHPNAKLTATEKNDLEAYLRNA